MCGIICLIQFGGRSIDQVQALKCLSQLDARGPDRQSHCVVNSGEQVQIFFGFARLAIMDKSDAGLQPFTNQLGNVVVCNGEIYNYTQLAQKYDIEMKTTCDCEILLPLYQKNGFETMIRQNLDAEFATILYDRNKSIIYAARDRYGVRPLYFGYHSEKQLFGFASELKALHSVMSYVSQVRPNDLMTVDLTNCDLLASLSMSPYYDYGHLIPNPDLSDRLFIQTKIKELLTTAVAKRLYADRPIGFLLSGGLDSSLIVAIATKILGPEKIVCFSTGVEGSPDVEAAKEVVKYLGIKNHHIVPFSVTQGLSELPNVIRTIETYDITTIRASTPQHLLAKYISQETEIKVLLSGEGSDEIHGSYRYFRDAPDANQFHKETVRLLSELYLFDNKRTDRTMAGHGLEVRVPFLDFDYVEFIMRIDPELLMYRPDHMEKQIVRDSFKGYLPDKILYRSKEAFSDAVSNDHLNWAQTIQQVADQEISDAELYQIEYSYNSPKTKDALYFRRIFDQIYPGRDALIPHYWLPKFQVEEILDPSARVLKCY